MPKVGSAAKPGRRKRNSQKKGKARLSTQMMAVSSHVGKVSPQLQAEFRKLWDKNAKVKKVIRDGPLIMTIYK